MDDMIARAELVIAGETKREAISRVSGKTGPMQRPTSAVRPHPIVHEGTSQMEMWKEMARRRNAKIQYGLRRPIYGAPYPNKSRPIAAPAQKAEGN